MQGNKCVFKESAKGRVPVLLSHSSFSEVYQGRRSFNGAKPSKVQKRLTAGITVQRRINPLPIPRQLVHRTAAVLMACGLIFSLLPGFAAADKADNQWGPGYTITPNGLQIDGIQPNNPRNRVILDNDMFHEDPGWLILSAAHKLGMVDLRGIIVTHEPNPQRHLNFGIKPWPTDQVADYNRMRQLALESGLWMMPHTLGAGTMLVRPESGNIDDTQYTSTPGSRLIIEQADASTPDNPLLIFVGGQATTVANALLEKPSIANRMIVIYAASFPRSYNTYDSWAAYVTVIMARCNPFVF